jgi:hypothetical protein
MAFFSHVAVRLSERIYRPSLVGGLVWTFSFCSHLGFFPSLR